jgi:hypothetical protein
MVGLWFELKDLSLQSRLATIWATPVVHFAPVIMEMRAPELFVQADREPQPPDICLQRDYDYKCNFLNRLIQIVQ